MDQEHSRPRSASQEYPQSSEVFGPTGARRKSPQHSVASDCTSQDIRLPDKHRVMHIEASASQGLPRVDMRHEKGFRDSHRPPQ
jgi:hypothetical protein